MALDAIQKAKFQEIKLKKMYEKRAKVSIKDFEIFRLNLIFLSVGLVLIVIGTLVIGLLLGYADGRLAISDLSSVEFSSNSSVYKAYVGAHFGAVSIGAGVFIIILSIVGFIDDYLRTKKRLIEKVVKEDQEKAAAEAAKNANLNMWQIMAMNIRNSKLAN